MAAKRRTTRPTILFLSGLDFKNKSIQVIRKTPEAYAERGWLVKYIVARDRARKGNYFYEPEINPAGVKVERLSAPLSKWRDRSSGTTYKIISRLAQWLVALRLAARAVREFVRGERCDVLYGYEVTGVLAMNLTRLALTVLGIPAPRAVSRFQGTILHEPLLRRDRTALLKRVDHLIAQRARTDLCIMTDDGTRGLDTLRMARSRAARVCFFVNGVEIPTETKSSASANSGQPRPDDSRLIVSVSRLAAWKRVDRVLNVFAEIVRRAPSESQARGLRLEVVGEGDQRAGLEEQARQLGIDRRVTFRGGIPHDQVSGLFQRADYFFSFYDLSNVGNPLLEAIAHRKLIFTLDNGDTSRWIEHGRNGCIFAPDDNQLARRAAEEFWRLENDPRKREAIAREIDRTARERLWTWSERMAAEVAAVRRLLAA